MKKSVIKNRKKRRLKKAVRRTLGALFMISAIIVAAIPFPDAVAADPTYAYNVTATDYLSGVNYANITKINAVTYNPTTDAKAYTVRQMSGGEWQLNWQFQFTKLDAEDNVITKYNDKYAADTVEISNKVRQNYFIVTQDNLNGFYASDTTYSMTDPIQGDSVQIVRKGGNVDYTFTAPDDEDEWFFTRYFNSLYTEYIDNYNNYKTSLDVYNMWIAAGHKDGDSGEPTVLTAPTPLTKKPSSLSDDDKLKFFCDIMIGENTGFTLQKVDDVRNSGTTGIQTIYIPKGTTAPAAVAAYNIDGNGFLSGKEYTIIGIAKEAFKDTYNVINLTLASEISHIGDSAFENSFVSNVVLKGAKDLGNAAFKNCKKLTTISLPQSVTVIGTEAFFGTALTSVTFPYSVSEIGPGAFADCVNLKTVSNDGNTTPNRTIDKYAFFNCTGLDKVDFGSAVVSQMGEGAFAVDQGVTGNMTEFNFPSATGAIENTEDLGDYVLAGRANLKKIVMPANFGRNKQAIIPEHAFWGCINLENFVFPDKEGSCGYAEFDDSIFSTVINNNFYIRGPKNNKEGTTASPRKCSWISSFLNSTTNHVPYVYNENGEDYYEVSDGKYVLVIGDDGILSSCNFVDTAADIDCLTIPEKVGTTSVTGIKEGCFAPGDAGTLERIKKLEVKDSDIITIGNNVFRGAKKLEEIDIGNSVTMIGSGAFSECPVLTTAKLGSGISSIGNDAFKNSPNLENILFAPPANGTSSFPLNNIGTDAFSTGGEKLTITGEAATDYAPFIWSMQPDNYMNKEDGVRVCYKTPSPSNLTIILDNQNNLPTLVDYPHYEDLSTVSADLITRYESGSSITPAEEALVKSTLNINVPSGVKSIDARGYFNNTSKKVDGVDPYSNSNSISAYFGSMKYKDQYQLNGLFNGFFGDTDGTDGKREYPTTDSTEKEDIGNDRIKSITLSTVEYLPNGCFYSCEGLETVNLGSSINDIEINPFNDIDDPGKTPFEDCTALTSVACGNDNFNADNGILYQNLANKKKVLLECFASRGTKVGSSTVSLNNDSSLASISQISPAAFRNCDTVTSVDFTGANNFDEIPDQCFSGCNLLTEVDLPANVDTIGDQAFADTGSYTKVIVRGREVSLGKNAFENVPQAYLVSYEDSGVRKAAKKQGANVEQTIDNMYTVKFYTYDGATLIESVQVEEGDTADAPEDSGVPAREGYTFTGWSRSLKNISEDMFVLAVYTLNAGVTPGVTPGTTPGVTPGVTNGVTPGTTNKVTPTPSPSVSPTASTTQYQLTVVYGSGSGKYASGTTVIINAIEPPAGKVFDKWVTDTTGVTIASATSMATTVKTTTSDATITATYKNTGSASGNSVNKVSSSNSGGATEVNSGNSNTKVDISKPGISNTDKAYASVSGSSDNFIIKISESDEAANEVATALSKQYSDMNPIKYFAMDIALYDATGTNKVENTDSLSVNITMPVPDALVQYAGNNKVGVVINGSLNVLNCKFLTIDGIPCISFTANHFSPYTIFVDTANLTQGTLDSTPKTGDGIHPKWFVVIAFACISLILFLKKDKVTNIKVA